MPNACSGHRHSFFEVAEYHFYSALARAAAFDSATEGSRQEHFEALADHHRQLADMGGELPGEFRKSRCAGGRGNRPDRRPRPRRRAVSTNRPSARRATTALSTTKASPTRWRRGSISARGLETSAIRPSPQCPALLSSAGAPTARCGNLIDFIHIWRVRRNSSRRPLAPDPPAGCCCRRQGVAGLVRRDRIAEADQSADDDCNRERGRGSRPFNTPGRR